MVYEFRCSGARLTLSISPRSSPDDPDGWRVDVHWGTSTDPEVVTAWGPTKRDAVAMSGQSWAHRAADNGRPAIDWKIIIEALDAVRAL